MERGRTERLSAFLEEIFALSLDWSKVRETDSCGADSCGCKGHRVMGAHIFIRKHLPFLTLSAQGCTQAYPPPTSTGQGGICMIWPLRNTNSVFQKWKRSLKYSFYGLHDIPKTGASDFYHPLYVDNFCFRI